MIKEMLRWLFHRSKRPQQSMSAHPVFTASVMTARYQETMIEPDMSDIPDQPTIPMLVLGRNAPVDDFHSGKTLADINATQVLVAIETRELPEVPVMR